MDPLVPEFRGRTLHDPLERRVVHGVPCDHEPEPGDPEHARVVRVGMADGDGPQLVALELEDRVLLVQHLDCGQVLRGDLPVRVLVGPEVPARLDDLGLCVFERGARGDGNGAWKALEEDGRAEEVVAVAVRDEDVSEGFVRDGLGDPVG